MVEAGHEVTPEQAHLLASMRSADATTRGRGATARLGLFGISAAILGGVWAFGRRYMRHVPVDIQDLFVLATLVCVGLEDRTVSPSSGLELARILTGARCELR